MPNSNLLGGDQPQQRAPGHDTDALGPSDSSDSGSDIQGELPMATGADEPDELGAMPVATGADTDRSGTGERGSATGGDRPGADILPDRITQDPTLADGQQDDSMPGDTQDADAADDAVTYSDAFAISDDDVDEDEDPSAERIDRDDDQALVQWAETLDATPEQLKAAIETVGDLAADVEMHLKGSHSTTNAERVENASDA